MSYIENLGRVKGDTGKVYVPVVNNQAHTITWELQDSTDLASPDDITPFVYVPSINNDGKIIFTLTRQSLNIPASIEVELPNEQNIVNTLDTRLVNNLPTINEAEEGVIYIVDGDAFVYDDETNDFYPLEYITRFDNYYDNTQTYNKSEIDTMFGDITECQNRILYTLDAGSINIQNGE